jgi:hypothetical protein
MIANCGIHPGHDHDTTPSPPKKQQYRAMINLGYVALYLVQGWKVLDAEALAQLDLPEHETVVEVPKALFRFAPPAVD